MAVVGFATPVWEGQTGSFKIDGSEITAVYQVEVNNPLDGPQTVVLARGLPPIGSFYLVGNDANPLLTLREMTPTRVTGTRLLWHVACKYQSPNSDQSQSGTDEDGKPQKDPRHWHDEIEIGYAGHTGPLEKATLVSPDLGRFRRIGDEGPPINSAGEVFSPPAERDLSRFVLRITKNLNSYPVGNAKDYLDAINSDNFTINKRKLGFVFPVKKYQAKMRNVSGRLSFANEIAYWPVTYEMEIDTRGDWRFDLIDKGFAAALNPGDQDGNGGTLSANDFVNGMPRLKQFTDTDGNPFTEPQLLDGTGKLLAPGKPAVYIKYAGYTEKPFAKLRL